VTHGELYQRLARFLGWSQPFSTPARALPTKVDPKDDLEEPGPTEVSVPPQPSKAKELGDTLRKVAPGPTAFKVYENAVTDSLKYALSDHFAVWLTQHGSENRLSIYDLIGRISSDHDFWNTIVSQFHSRYVIFEFKLH